MFSQPPDVCYGVSQFLTLHRPHVHAHAHAQARRRVLRHECMDKGKQAGQAHVQAGRHARAHAHSDMRTNARAWMQASTCMCTLAQMHMLSHLHTQKHAHRHAGNLFDIRTLFDTRRGVKRVFIDEGILCNILSNP